MAAETFVYQTTHVGVSEQMHTLVNNIAKKCPLLNRLMQWYDHCAACRGGKSTYTQLLCNFSLVPQRRYCTFTCGSI